MKKLGLLAVMVAIAGCTGDDDDDTFSGDTEVSGTVDSITTGGDVPLAGATVEAVGGGPSTTSAADGSWTLMLTTSENLTLRARAASHWGSQIRTNVATLSSLNFGLPHDDLVTAVGSVIGITPNTSQGLVAVNFFALASMTSGGYGATLSAANGGSFTFNSAGTPVLSSVTLPNGDPTLIFVNVAPGTTTITPSGPMTCVDALGEANVPVDAKVNTLGLMFCQ